MRTSLWRRAMLHFIPQKVSFLWPHPFQFAAALSTGSRTVQCFKLQASSTMNRTREPVLRSVRVTINVVLAKLPVISTSPHPPPKKKKTRRIVTSRPNLQESEDDFSLCIVLDFRDKSSSGFLPLRESESTVLNYELLVESLLSSASGQAMSYHPAY